MEYRAFQPIPADEYEKVRSLNDTYFYHTMNLPGIGLCQGHWDLRGIESNYLGGVDVRGKTFFDCGVASGFMSFEMERRGAHVVGLDLDETQSDDMGLVPFHHYERIVGHSFEKAFQSRKESQRKLRNSFFIARQALKSRVQLNVGNIMFSPIPMQTDGALFGAILLHLRDPIGALYNVVRNVRETVIISDTLEDRNPSLTGAATMFFRPSINDPKNVGTWWYLTPSLFKTALEVVGFKTFEISQYEVKHSLTGSMASGFTLVARR